MLQIWAVLAYSSVMLSIITLNKKIAEEIQKTRPWAVVELDQ